MKSIKHFFPFIVLVLYLLLFIFCAIQPFNRGVWWAENIPVIIPVFLLVLMYKKFRFSNLSYFLMWFFISIHTIGGHYTFELVPFDFFNNLISKLNFDFLFPSPIICFILFCKLLTLHHLLP